MSKADVDLRDLAQAFEQFTRTTQTMEEAYRRLEARLHELDRELAAKNRALELTRDYLRSVLESMTDGVIAVDTDGVITTFNHAAARILGYAPDAMVGRPFPEALGRDYAIAPGQQAAELRASDGTQVPVSERNSPLTGPDGRRLGSVKVFQDLREVEALREQVRRKDRLAALGEMAATVAHEIRNPLGGLRGFAALLARDLPEGDERGRLVEKILTGANELNRIVTELLEYTRPLQLRLRPTRCDSLVESALGYLDWPRDRISVQAAVPGDAAVAGDPDRLRQAILNVLLNAVQSIDGPGEVHITATVYGERVALSVRDTGCGMAADQLERIFYPFFTTKEKGTGLGLAVAAKIAEGHGGALSAESTPGAGSVFTFHLPKAD